MIEIINHFIYINSMKIIRWFGYNRLTYKIFSFFYGLGYKYSFGCIRIVEKKYKKEKLDTEELLLYIEFMPWSFVDYTQTKDKKIKNKIMLYGMEDFLSMTKFLEKNKKKLPEKIISYSNKRIAILIHKKLGFKFLDFKDYKDFVKNCKGDVVQLETNTDFIINNKNQNEKIFNKLKLLFENN
jgi:hypothetical protein